MKKSFVFLLLTVLVFLSAGCGKAEKKENRKEYYYVPEHRELTFGVNYINSMTSDDTYIFPRLDISSQLRSSSRCLLSELNF